ncbi:magnesium chelatase subunit D [Rhodobacterales bacterium HKCCE4037]|nr:magnesium chelatase subunit D [Rhodobacterales bacterium HKCCE4037]
MPDLADPFARAALALDLLAVDPGLGGLHLRARAGPVRDRLTARLGHLDEDAQRLHPAMTDTALLGGLDLAATLASGHRVDSKGVLGRPGALVLTMAERTPPGFAARLCARLDASRDNVVIALDEAAAEGEGVPAALSDRLAFSVDLSGVAIGAIPALPEPNLADARRRLARVIAPADLPLQIAELTMAFGIDSPRAALFALRAARAHAALRDMSIGSDDVEAAVALTLAHRATQVPELEEEAETESAPPQDPPQDQSGPDGEDDIPQEMLIAAVAALLPPDLLNATPKVLRGATGDGAGAMRQGNRRGRPLPSRPGRPGSGARIDIVATLRAAAPWQTIRKATARRPGLQIRAADLRLHRFQDTSDRLVIFAVDASGSSALARLAEAKGAVEYLLAEAYARRDHVCLVAFRGTEAEVLLPPTRSLVQTKRRLAELPGGGGTPLAAGLQLAAQEARTARRKGMDPVLCLLTDGRANIALDGTADRQRAPQDALTIGKTLIGLQTLVIDCGTRPSASLKELADTSAAQYLALPRADAARLSRAVSDALG